MTALINAVFFCLVVVLLLVMRRKNQKDIKNNEVGEPAGAVRKSKKPVTRKSTTSPYILTAKRWRDERVGERR